MKVCPDGRFGTYEPPLYYLIGAAVLSVCNLSVNDPAVGHRFAFPWRIFRHRTIRFRFFECAAPASGASRVHRPFVGGVSANAFVSGTLCDECNCLVATLTTAALYLCLRLLKNEVPRASQFAWLGAGAWCGDPGKGDRHFAVANRHCCDRRQLRSARAPIAISVRNLGLLLAICFAVCGWHYARIWVKFGTPLLGNWDVAQWVQVVASPRFSHCS